MLHMINSWRQHELGLQPIRTGNHGGILTHVHKVTPGLPGWGGVQGARAVDLLATRLPRTMLGHPCSRECTLGVHLFACF